ncbi:YceI family protein [Yeosuana marina]|uniref:YceI family protein n=1 Tax=Yeosuana marina TaxID=1565536 RepID=UPI00141DD81B|nr:YceI family protein [Yeosuana marina]
MKRNNFFQLILTVLFACYMSSSMYAQQQDAGTQISYKVNFGPVYPIEGDSNQIEGKISFNDDNDSIEKISFDVPLNSFTGINSGYLEWIGNSWYNPDMSFKSNKIKLTGDNKLMVSGNLEFRRRIAPVKIDFTRKDSDNSIILEGNFDMRVRDYFTFNLPFELAPNTVSFKIKLVFDKPLSNT